MKANQSKEMKKINRIFKAVAIVSSVALGIGALIYNPGHLFTAALIFAAGLECEIVKVDANDIC